MAASWDTKPGQLHVDTWAMATPDQISKRFHNLVMADTPVHIRLRVLDSLFAVPPPVGRGVYRHHDGYRS
jgi:hypothetical protein